MKRFKDYLNEDFLNESISKNYQYDVDKNSFEDFENDLSRKADKMGVTYVMNKTNGVSKITVFLRLNGEQELVNELIQWIEERY